MKPVPVITPLVRLIVSYMRGVPLIVHLFVMMYSLPQASSSLLAIFGVTVQPHDFPSLIIVITTFSLLEAAIESENIRGHFSPLIPVKLRLVNRSG